MYETNGRALSAAAPATGDDYRAYCDLVADVDFTPSNVVTPKTEVAKGI